MTLRDLNKPQSDAAHEAARCLMQGSIDREADRERFAAAVTRLCILLPEDVDAKAIIGEAARWQMLDTIGAMVSGLPVECAA
jgi:hypothetical protein